MKQSLLLFNLFLLTTLPINLFGADLAEPRAKQQKIENPLTFQIKKSLSQEEKNYIRFFCRKNELSDLPKSLKPYTIIIAYLNEKIVGFALCMPQAKGNSLLITHFGIDEDHQRKGYGKLLFEEIKKTHPQVLKFRVFSAVTATDFYIKLGFIHNTSLNQNCMEYTESAL